MDFSYNAAIQLFFSMSLRYISIELWYTLKIYLKCNEDVDID